MHDLHYTFNRSSKARRVSLYVICEQCMQKDSFDYNRMIVEENLMLSRYGSTPFVCVIYLHVMSATFILSKCFFFLEYNKYWISRIQKTMKCSIIFTLPLSAFINCCTNSILVSQNTAALKFWQEKNLHEEKHQIKLPRNLFLWQIQNFVEK